MKLTRIVPMAAVVVLGFCLSQAAFADSVWNLAPGLTADAAFTASGGTWNLQLTFANTSGTAATVNVFSLQLFQASNVAPPTFQVTGSPALNGWTPYIDSKGDNGTSTCASPSPAHNKGWLCTGGTPLTIGTGGLMFSLGGTYLTSGLNADTLDLISNGTIGGSKWAISANAGSVPEPASLGLLATGIAALGLFGRKLKR